MVRRRDWKANMKAIATGLIWLVYFSAMAQTERTQILLLGSDHLAQIHRKDNPNTDVFTPKRQQELAEFASQLDAYRPDMIQVEVLPERQREIDSLYTLYLKDGLNFEQLEDGRSEVYQLAFRMGRRLHLKKIYCVNAPGGTSQSVLDNGDHIELYQHEMAQLRKVVGEAYAGLQKGSLSLKDFLVFINQPQTYNKVYHLRYITPARVTNGRFKHPDPMIDTAFVDPRYIGAELTSVFKNRDYKIYSNIVNAQMKERPKRIMLLIGAAHLGSLRSILRDDEEFALVDASKFLK